MKKIWVYLIFMLKCTNEVSGSCWKDWFPRYKNPCWLHPHFTKEKQYLTQPNQKLISTSTYIPNINCVCQTVLKISCPQENVMNRWTICKQYVGGIIPVNGSTVFFQLHSPKLKKVAFVGKFCNILWFPHTRMNVISMNLNFELYGTAWVIT